MKKRRQNKENQKYPGTCLHELPADCIAVIFKFQMEIDRWLLAEARVVFECVLRTHPMIFEKIYFFSHVFPRNGYRYFIVNGKIELPFIILTIYVEAKTMLNVVNINNTKFLKIDENVCVGDKCFALILKHFTRVETLIVMNSLSFHDQGIMPLNEEIGMVLSILYRYSSNKLVTCLINGVLYERDDDGKKNEFILSRYYEKTRKDNKHTLYDCVELASKSICHFCGKIVGKNEDTTFCNTPECGYEYCNDCNMTVEGYVNDVENHICRFCIWNSNVQKIEMPYPHKGKGKMFMFDSERKISECHLCRFRCIWPIHRVAYCQWCDEFVCTSSEERRISRSDHLDHKKDCEKNSKL